MSREKHRYVPLERYMYMFLDVREYMFPVWYAYIRTSRFECRLLSYLHSNALNTHRTVDLAWYPP